MHTIIHGDETVLISNTIQMLQSWCCPLSPSLFSFSRLLRNDSPVRLTTFDDCFLDQYFWRACSVVMIQSSMFNAAQCSYENENVIDPIEWSIMRKHSQNVDKQATWRRRFLPRHAKRLSYKYVSFACLYCLRKAQETSQKISNKMLAPEMRLASSSIRMKFFVPIGWDVSWGLGQSTW